jgi:hypothetical protein
MPPSTLSTSNGSARGEGAALVLAGGVDGVGAGVGDDGEDSLVVDAEGDDAEVELEVELEVTRGEPASDGLVHAVVVTRTAATSRRVGRGRIIHANPTARDHRRPVPAIHRIARESAAVSGTRRTREGRCSRAGSALGQARLARTGVRTVISGEPPEEQSVSSH